MEAKERARRGIAATLIGVGANLVLFVLKIWFGLAIGSLALLADAVDTLGDVLTAFVAFLGFRVGTMAAHPKHPYGHERAEEIASLTVAILLLVVGLQFIVQAGQRLFGPPQVGYSIGAVIVVIASLVVKLMLAGATFATGGQIGSRALKGIAWNYLFDALASVLVLVALYGRLHGIYWLDPVMAAVIGLVIIRVGLRLFLESSDVLMGHGIDERMRAEIERLVLAERGVLGVRGLEMHWYGRKRRLNLRIEVPEDLTVRDAEAIARRVQQALGSHSDWEPIVHVAPVERGHPRGGHTPDALTE